MRVDRLITDIDREWCPFSPLITYLRGDRNKKGFTFIRTGKLFPILGLKTDRIRSVILKHPLLATLDLRIAFFSGHVNTEIQWGYIIRYSNPLVIREHRRGRHAFVLGNNKATRMYRPKTQV